MTGNYSSCIMLSLYHFAQQSLHCAASAGPAKSATASADVSFASFCTSGLTSECPRFLSGCTRSRNRCFNTFASGKPPSVFRSQMVVWLVIGGFLCGSDVVAGSVSCVTTIWNTPPFAGSRATSPMVVSNEDSSSWAKYAARRSHLHCVQYVMATRGRRAFIAEIAGSCEVGMSAIVGVRISAMKSESTRRGRYQLSRVFAAETQRYGTVLDMAGIGGGGELEIEVEVMNAACLTATARNIFL